MKKRKLFPRNLVGRRARYEDGRVGIIIGESLHGDNYNYKIRFPVGKEEWLSSAGTKLLYGYKRLSAAELDIIRFGSGGWLPYIGMPIISIADGNRHFITGYAVTQSDKKPFKVAKTPTSGGGDWYTAEALSSYVPIRPIKDKIGQCFKQIDAVHPVFKMMALAAGLIAFDYFVLGGKCADKVKELVGRVADRACGVLEKKVDTP